MTSPPPPPPPTSSSSSSSSNYSKPNRKRKTTNAPLNSETETEETEQTKKKTKTKLPLATGAKLGNHIASFFTKLTGGGSGGGGQKDLPAIPAIAIPSILAQQEQPSLPSSNAMDALPADIQVGTTTPILSLEAHEMQPQLQQPMDLDPLANSSNAADAELANQIPPPETPTQQHAKIPFTSSLVQLQKGKVVFKEKKMNLDKHPVTISELLKFHEYKKTISKNDNIESFPDLHYPLLAKLIQDSDATLVTLTKHVKELLFPDWDGSFGDDDDGDDDDGIKGDPDLGFTLPDSEISKAITTIATRNNYGLQIDGLAIPAAYAIWRWESTDLTFLGEFKDRFEARIKNRSQARRDLVQVFEGLRDDEKEAVTVGGSKRQSVSPHTPVAAGTSFAMALDVEVDVDLDAMTSSCAKTPGDRAVASSLPCSSTVETPDSVANSVTKNSKQLLKEKKEAEKLAALKAKEEAKEKKEQEKREAKEAKEEMKRRKEEEKMLAEKAKEEAKLKKEEDRLKAEKAKEERTKKDMKRVDKSQPSLASFIFRVQKEAPPPPPVVTNQEEADALAFRERFPQFHVKLGATIAQHNRFFKQTSESVIDEIMRQDSPADVISEFKSFLSTSAQSMRSTLRTKKQKRLLESQAKLVLMRKQSSNLLNASGEAPEEEEEDPYKKYRHVKWKLLQFAEEFRPAYFGTWTKKSTIATRGKNPWRKEIVSVAAFGGDSAGWVMNYDVDSEAEWEEDEPGEELGSEIDEEEGAGDKNGGGNHGDGDMEEMDDWMVPDGYLSEDEADDEEGGEVVQQKASEKNNKEIPKKKIGPLVPVVVCWFGNDELGVSDAYFFEAFQVSWMIDETIDPFVFCQKNAPALSDAATPNSRLNSSGSGLMHKSLAKALKANGERQSFDENDLGEFVTMIQGSVLPLPQLVALTKDRFMNVSKVQLELKVRQIAEKRRVVGAEKQVWYIKPDYQKYCPPGSIPELVVVATPVVAVPTVVVAPRSLDPNVVRRKAASKPSIIDPPTSPLPESPRHFVKSGGRWEEDDIIGDILAEGEGEGDVEIVMGEVREDNYFEEIEMTVDESVAWKLCR
ncbi:UNVERIFIED_CONTAM: hypothetical protein HDU68_000793 [Siphonaria sp. JEL0065]|nr:hypothetical protein HDU68_000793 [Siphonaria sp. JEL0065]